MEADPRDPLQPSGKQSDKYGSYACYYTRSTGIYAPVWIENVPSVYLKDIKLDPDVDNSALNIRMKISGEGDKKITLTALYDGKEVGKVNMYSSGAYVMTKLPLSALYLWEIENPRLYDLLVEVESEHGKDLVGTYFGMRKIEMDKACLKINGKRVLQRLVLDQG